MSDKYREILKRYWGYDDFRGIQGDIIASIGSGHDTLGLMPTGGGKSITFQVPALAMEGVCLVITPLIALMKDQVHHLRQNGIFASAIYSGLSHDEVLRILDNCILGRTRFLYVSPERLSSDLFVTKLRHMRISFITVDEAHCISQWGYDFRPAYLQISTLRHLLPGVPVLALTATATPPVVHDICEKLTPPSSLHTPPSSRITPPSSLHTPPSSRITPPSSLNSFAVYRMSFARPNLTYLVRHATDKLHELVHILSHTQGSAIVYVRSRRRCKELAEYLADCQLSATYYHAGLEPQDKDRRQRDWQHDQQRVMVATNAFGMGIDKSDVRLVVHYDCPDSIEAYFQEAGRAGRDGRRAYAVLLYHRADHGKLLKRIDDTFPPLDYVRQVYEHLAYYFQLAVGDGFGVLHEFDIQLFCQRFHHFPIRVQSALYILQRAGYLEYDEAPDQQTRVRFLLERHELYRLHDTTDHEERVLDTLLRNYGGLFADFCFIDDDFIARQCALSVQQLHQVLLVLSQRRVLQYIPRRQVPTVRYLQRREDPEHLSFPPEVYQQRLDQYKERIQSMLHYVESDDTCRSRLLLSYFGETDAKDCGQCDVCRSSREAAVIPTPSRDEVCRQILALLDEGGAPLPLPTLHRLALPTEAIDDALRHLTQEELVLIEDGYLRKA